MAWHVPDAALERPDLVVIGCTAICSGRAPPVNDLMAWNADGTRLPFRMHVGVPARMFLHNALARGRMASRRHAGEPRRHPGADLQRRRGPGPRSPLALGVRAACAHRRGPDLRAHPPAGTTSASSIRPGSQGAATAPRAPCRRPAAHARRMARRDAEPGPGVLVDRLGVAWLARHSGRKARLRRRRWARPDDGLPPLEARTRPVTCTAADTRLSRLVHRPLRNDAQRFRWFSARPLA